jgi:glycosyltransferase involved in cell wall biosynthesis
MIRIYGVTGTYTSHATVTRGFERWARHHGLFSGLYSLNDVPDWEEDVEGDGVLMGARAPIAIFTGRLDQSYMMTRWGNHQHRLAMVAPNSSAMPRDLMKRLNHHCTGFLAPSNWARDVLVRYTDHPVWVAPHGVCPEFLPELGYQQFDELYRQYMAGQFSVLHFTTSDRQRKGTKELVEGWIQSKRSETLPPDSRLYVVMDAHVERVLQKLIDDSSPYGVLKCTRANLGRGLTPEQMAKTLSSCHLVCQPSRGEGFGLVPLQALAVGTPALMTPCTGHSEYVDTCPASCVLRIGEPGPIDDLPGEGSLAPTVSPEDIAAQLGDCFEHWIDLKKCALDSAQSVADRWAWERAMLPLAHYMKKLGSS